MNNLFNIICAFFVFSRANDKSCLSRIASFLCEDIDIRHAHFQLIAFGFATGMVDVVTLIDFSIYTSIQTGNIIILGLFITGATSARIGSICATLFGFLGAACISGQLTHVVGDRRRWWMIFSCFLQTILLFIVAIILYTNTILTTHDHAFVLVLLLAISFGCQVSMTRVLACPEIPTVVLTLTFVDFLMDPKALKWSNRARNRRVFFLIFFVIGVIIGSFAYTRVNRQLPLILAGIIKSLTTLSFFFVGKAPPRPAAVA